MPPFCNGTSYYTYLILNVNRFYFKKAKKFLDDKDAPDGKALKYYLAMKK